MITIDDFEQEISCIYKDEKYIVRNNGAIKRLRREGKPKRKQDDVWTFGNPSSKSDGYLYFCGIGVHRIVATAFHGSAPSAQHVVDHIDTNRKNNRPDNLRWLTKLENILNNEITRKKVIMICGSIEAFLRNPKLLYNHELEEPNFSWMRTVSKEEALNTLANMEKWLKKPIVETKGEGMGEWVFQGESTVVERQAPDSTPIEELREKYGIPQWEEETEDNFDDMHTQKTEPMQPEKKIEKKMIVSCIIDLCKDNGWSYVKKYMDEIMKCDVLIMYNDSKFALKVSRKTIEFLNNSDAEESAEYNRCYPVFDLVWKDEEILVSQPGLPSMSVRMFVKAYIEGRIQKKQTLTVKRIGVYFVEISCYYCKARYHVYFIKKIMDDTGIVRTFPDDIYYEFDVFNPAISDRVKEYVSTHKEEGLVMGEIKTRFSRTMQESYMSFGCPVCDGLYGNHYYNDLVNDCMYDNSDENVRWIDLESDLSINDYPHWEYVC